MSSLTKTQESIQNCWSPKQHTSGFRISDPQEHRRWFTISDPQTTQEIQNFWSPKQQRRGFRIFFFWKWGGGGGGGGGAWLLINVGFLKPVILCSKALLVLRSRLELGIVSHKVFFLFLPAITICSFNNNEVRNAPMAKLLYHAAASAQFFAIITW